MSKSNPPESYNDFDVAIIGLSGRFPGAKNIAEFWNNIQNDVESISFFTEEELIESGIDQQLIKQPNYVKARGVLDDVDKFDATLFGIFPREAEMMDPQHRLFLECAWEALEDAGYDADRYEGLIGVYGGVGMNTYLLSFLMTHSGSLSSAEVYQYVIGNDKDFVTTRTSYKMNLRGPSFDIQTACSTSLSAVYLACQSLINYQCDMALAGGISVVLPQKQGYLYQEGMILSPDGHCRPFDANAGGTIGGNGAAMVVLKRLTDAINDRDHIYAVIKGSASNNDGSNRVGYTAPGVEGQAEVIAMAQAAADVEPDTISYIETHGTGTTLGDPIEIAALTQVFRERTDRIGFCPIGAVKANVGHLDAAAGATGLIKTALMLKHKVIPPATNFEQPNPKIDFQNSPFYVNTKLTDWKTDGTPRRAGVSSFGIGGTNVHIVMEEAPTVQPASETRKYQLLTFSAKTDTTLENMTDNLVTFLKNNTNTNLADAAYTLNCGRKPLDHRRAVVCQSIAEAGDILEKRAAEKILTAYHDLDEGEPPVVFMFSGQGAQYVNMGKELYDTEPTFREQVDYCAEFLKPHLGFDLRDVLYLAADKYVEKVPPFEATGGSTRQSAGRGQGGMTLEKAKQKINETHITQPALFVIEYAMAKLWLDWGIQPQAMIGHSIGEYVAACLAGVFSLDDALTLVAARGRLMQTMPGGAMLSVLLDEEKVRPYLDDGFALAAINGQSLCTISGTYEAIDQLEKQLSEQGIQCRRLHTSHAFHSRMMDPILEPFTAEVKKVKLNPPQLPYLSNVSGTWISVEEATNPQYWANHLRQTVRFADGIRELLDDPQRIFLEVGPGKTLSTLARQVSSKTSGRIMLSSMRHPQEEQSDVALLLNTLGRLWLAGAVIDWNGYYAYEKRNRIPLPTYPFERQRYWLEGIGNRQVAGVAQKDAKQKQELKNWFYLPSWKRADLPEIATTDTNETKTQWLVFVDKVGLGSKMVNRLIQTGHEVVTVLAGEQFDRINGEGLVYSINPGSPADYVTLIERLNEEDKIPQRIVHLWNIANQSSFEDIQQKGFYSLIYLVQALGKQHIMSPIQMEIVSKNMQEVTGEESLSPEKATLLGACKVIPQEYPNITCRSIDVNGSVYQEKLTDYLLTEFFSEATDLVVAYRGKHRWVQTFEKTTVDEKVAKIQEEGVYVITGGLGRIGLTFARFLAHQYQAKLVLVDKPTFPERIEWEQWLKKQDDGDFINRKIQQLLEIELAGGEVLIIQADVAKEEQMRRAVDQVYEKHGRLNGVIHAAGFVGEQSLKPVQEIEPSDCELHFEAKVHGLRVLEKVLNGKAIDFCLLQSSLASILGGLGMIAYSAANIFMDVFAAKHNQSDATRWISVNWDGWDFERENIQDTGIGANLAEIAITPGEGVKVLERVLSLNGMSQIIISTADLQTRIDQWIKLESLHEKQTTKPILTMLHPRPNLPNPYVAPRNELEREIVDTWQELLGIDQIGIYDNFFELGGHSLLATQLVSRLRETYQVELPLRDLFESPTIATLSESINKIRSAKQAEDNELAEMLKLVEQMSDEEAKAMLEAKKSVKT